MSITLILSELIIYANIRFWHLVFFLCLFFILTPTVEIGKMKIEKQSRSHNLKDRCGLEL